MKKINKKIIIITSSIIFIIAVIAISLSIYFFNKDKNDNNDDGNDNIGIDKLIGDINLEVKHADEEGRNLQDEAKALNATYSDVIGWLRIAGTSIDTPIFHTTDNEYYLKHNRDKSSTEWGEAFLDYRNDISKIDNMVHLIIYGHNTKKDDNFTPLLNYKNEEFFNAHQIIEFSTLDGNYKWQIFSTYVTDTDFFYIDTNFADANEYTQFLYTLESKRMYNNGIEVIGNETILTLSTCDYSRTNGRFVVQAKLIKE